MAGSALAHLIFLDPQGKFEILRITAKASEGMGEAEKETWAELPHSSFDLVIMNPPFVRATVHEAERLNVPNPMFAAFASTAEEQKAMSRAAQRLTAGTSAHGNAGEASIFLVLADRKLRVGGTLALVMPLSLMTGGSWEQSRQLLMKNYNNLVIVSNAGAAHDEMSFSADTGMAECLFVAKKGAGESQRATFVVVAERPPFPMSGLIAAKQIRLAIQSGKVPRLEDGPVGGSALYFGDDVMGYALAGCGESPG